MVAISAGMATPMTTAANHSGSVGGGGGGDGGGDEGGGGLAQVTVTVPWQWT